MKQLGLALLHTYIKNLYFDTALEISYPESIQERNTAHTFSYDRVH